jgi:hypothetical protein
MTSLVQSALAGTEGLLACPPTAALLDRSQQGLDQASAAMIPRQLQ